MDWQEVIRRWRALHPAEKKARRLEAIPRSVAQSMAFEGSPLPPQWLAEQQRIFDARARRVREQAGLLPRSGEDAAPSLGDSPSPSSGRATKP